MIKQLANFPVNTEMDYSERSSEQLQIDYESLFSDSQNSLSAQNYGAELSARKANKRKIDFAQRLHEIT